MQSLFTFTAPATPCGYLPGRDWRLRYEVVGELTAAEYERRLEAGWRKFGRMLFTTACPACTACRSLRVGVDTFRPSEGQRRAWRKNRADVTVTVGRPEVTAEKLALYDGFHAAQADRVGWPPKGGQAADAYAETFVENPFPVDEWCYRVGGKLVGVGYADRLPTSLSAVYFFHDPAEHKRSLGTFNVLTLLDAAAGWGLAWVYLGFMVEGCRSLEYKAKFRPHEVLAGGAWGAGPGGTSSTPGPT